MKNSIPCFLLLICLCISCMLDLEDENFVKVDNTPDTSFVGDLEYFYDWENSQPVKDTVWLEDSVALRIASKYFMGCEIIVDGDTVLQSNDPIFTLKKGDREFGAHSLNIVQYVKSGTGSLADKNFTEYAAYQQAFVLMIVPKYVPEITNVTLEDGTVQVKWKPYLANDFQAYEISIYGIDDYYRDKLVGKVSFNSQSQTNFNDITYLGKRVSYILSVKRGDETLSSDKYITEFKYDHGLELTRIAENRFKLSWKSPPFYRNVNAYSIRVGSKVFQNNDSPHSLSIEFDGSMIYGERDSFNLVLSSDEIESAEPEQEVATFSNKVEYRKFLTFGKEIFPFDALFYSKGDNAFYLLTSVFIPPGNKYDQHPNGIYKLDKETLEVIDSVKVPEVGNKNPVFVMSAGGNSVFLLHDNGLIQQIHKDDLSIGEKFSTNIELPIYYNNADYTVSNNNRIVLVDIFAQVRIFDFNTKEFLLNTRSASTTHISADGNFFINGRDIYSYDGEQFTLKTTLPYEGEYVRFLNNESQVFIASDNKIILYDYINDIEVKSFDVALYELGTGHLDQATKTFTCYSSMAGIQFVNIETGEIIRKSSSWGGYLLEGDVLFVNFGFALKDY